MLQSLESVIGARTSCVGASGRPTNPNNEVGIIKMVTESSSVRVRNNYFFSAVINQTNYMMRVRALRQQQEA